MPKRVDDNVIAALMTEGLMITGSTDISELVEQIDEADEKQIVWVPLEHRIPAEKSNKMIKSANQDHYLYLDSSPVIKEAVELARDFAAMTGKKFILPKSYDIKHRVEMTNELARSTGMYAYFLIKSALHQREGEPPIGAYWVPSDNRARAFTWMRAFRGYEIYLDHQDQGNVVTLDKEFYGRRNMRVKSVRSQTDKRKKYGPFDITNMPITTKANTEQYVYWRLMEGTCHASPDKGYRGCEHSKRRHNLVMWTKQEIGAFYVAAVRLRETQELSEGVEIQVNPFPMSRSNYKEFVRKLREQAPVGRNGLNMTEMDRLIGARLMLSENYDHNCAHWTKST